MLTWAQCIFANLKRWALGVYHSLLRKHLQSYLTVLVFRFNCRRFRHAACRSLFGIATIRTLITYKMLLIPETTR